MTYVINKTNGDVLTEVDDGTINQVSTDLTLIGKNSSSYGEFFNENFVRLLENFANTSSPNNPVEGQLWYDTTDGRLKVYDGNGFKVSGGTIVSDSVPSSITTGDIWIDSYKKQMHFNDGSTNFLVGPLYTAQQGTSGLQVVDVMDTNNISHTIVLLYVKQVILGVFSHEAFTPITNQIPGWTGQVKVGFTASSLTGIKFNVPATVADSLIAEDGSYKSAQSFLQVDPADGYSVSNGQIRVLNSQPMLLGTNQNVAFKFDSNKFQINSQISNQNFEINSLSNLGLLPSLHIAAATQRIGIYTDVPTAMLDVAGDVRVRGDLTVEGTTTTINTNNLQVEDLLIEIGKVTSPSNSTANGGGISLEGGTDGDKTLTWSSTGSNWTSSENFNLATGKTYKINNFDVLTINQLGTTVNSAPGLTSIGQLVSLSVDYININDNIISYVNAANPNGDVVLTPKGSGTVNVSNFKISNVATPTSNADATTKLYVDTKFRSTPLGLSINQGALTEAQVITNIISKIYPVAGYENNTTLRVWCIDLAVAKEFRVVSSAWEYIGPIA